MDFIYKDLGHRSRGDIVVVTLSAWANVRLLDSVNFLNYRNGRSHRYVGGLVKQSPFRISIPSNGQWYAAVDTQGLRNGVRANIQVQNGSAFRPLPEIRENRRALSDVLRNADQSASPAPETEFDVFISHATEDKQSVVRPLAEALKARSVSVWYDEFELRVGDSLRRKIDAGIARSRFGLVVLSKSFFAKGWAQYELDGLVTMSNGGIQVMLPIWHEISKDELMRHSPSLADKVALRTADYSIEEIADELALVIHGE